MFPQGYLKAKGGFRPRADKEAMNTILNRTLISDGTNRRISDRAPAAYLDDPEIFSSDAAALLAPHFVDAAALAAMRDATAASTAAEVAAAYGRFRAARESVIVARIRSACGLT